MEYVNLHSVLGSILYSVIGIVFFIVAYKLMEWFLPFDVNKELAEDHNTAVGVVVGAVMLGLAVIIAAAIH